MKPAVLLSLLALASATPTQDAPETVSNPVGPVYEAVLLEKSSTTIRGSLSATAHHSGRGIVIDVDLSGFPADDGPYTYHLHVDPVPADGNCSTTLDHLDPFGRGQKPPCDSPHPETCEPGDLSGKHGKITVSGKQHFLARYHELYASTLPGEGTFFGNRSFVVHNKDGKRLNCGNFRLVEVEEKNCSHSMMPSGTGTPTRPISTGTGSMTYTPPTATPSLPVYTGGAAKVVISSFILVLPLLYL